ncbi:MAG: RNA polymerase sigma factor [Acidobacteriia bacterium]|nr:RNA polymerase sigma factor [Terriglobia bacterium]
MVLVREAQRGDPLAFDELVRQHDRAVLGLALRLTKSEADAQDIYQEAFLKAYSKLNTFRFECSFATWIYRIVSNLCLDHLRKSNRRKENPAVAVNAEGQELDLLDEIPDTRTADPEQQVLLGEMNFRVAQALRNLTPHERIVFELRHYQGLRLRTIGTILNRREEAVKSTLFRATQKLRLRLAARSARWGR